MAVVCTLGALAGVAPAWAHQTSVTHVELTIDDGSAEVHARVLATPLDLTEASGGDKAEPLTAASLPRAGQALAALVAARLAIANDGAPCAADAPSIQVAPAAEAYFEIAWTARCSAPLASISLDYDLFFDIDPLHAAVLLVRRGDATPASTILKAGASRFVWDPEGERPSGFLPFIGSGIDHIVYGFDHIAFVLALLLVLVLGRQPGSRALALCEIRSSLRRTAGIVSAFTVAHSLTLIAAALGWISLPGRFVEAVIALSIVYVAVENIVRPVPRARYAVAFAFGLVHGLGFARMLEVLLPPDGIIVPLLAFNLGVELGQLAIVITVLPLLHLLARGLGARRYAGLALPLLSGAVALLGALWLLERIAGITVLGF